MSDRDKQGLTKTDKDEQRQIRIKRMSGERIGVLQILENIIAQPGRNQKAPLIIEINKYVVGAIPCGRPLTNFMQKNKKLKDSSAEGAEEYD